MSLGLVFFQTPPSTPTPYTHTHTHSLTGQQKSWRSPDVQLLPLRFGGLCMQCRHITKIPLNTAVRHLRLAIPPLALSSRPSAHFFLQLLFQCLSAGAGSCQKNKYIHPEKSHSFTETTLILAQLLPPSLSPSQIRSACMFHPSGRGFLWLASVDVPGDLPWIAVYSAES